MRRLFLDSEPLSALGNAQQNVKTLECEKWLKAVLAAGYAVYLPKVIDYELRRELIRAGNTNSIAKLDALATQIKYLPLNTDAMRLAADLWAWARNARLSTGDPKKIDVDVILAAQALTLGATLTVPVPDLLVVTSNVAHLSRFLPADLWQNIRP